MHFPLHFSVFHFSLGGLQESKTISQAKRVKLGKQKSQTVIQEISEFFQVYLRPAVQCRFIYWNPLPVSLMAFTTSCSCQQLLFVDQYNSVLKAITFISCDLGPVYKAGGRVILASGLTLTYRKKTTRVYKQTLTLHAIQPGTDNLMRGCTERVWKQIES